MPPRMPTSRCGSGTCCGRGCARTARSRCTSRSSAAWSRCCATWRSPASRWMAASWRASARISRSAWRCWRREIHELAGRPFNVGSPKQLGEILFDEMKLPGGRSGKATGAWGTDAAVLRGARRPGRTTLPARTVLDWRQLSKLKSTYVDGLAAQIDPRDGRVHTDFAMANTSHRPALLDRARTCRTSRSAPRKAAHPPRLRRRARPCADVAPTTARSSCGCWRTWPTCRRCGRPSPPARTSTPAPRPTSSACRWTRWTRKPGAAPRRSISASSTACRPSAWPAGSASAGRGARHHRCLFRASIPASATPWSG